MAGYWPTSLFEFLWTETKSRSIKPQKENEANIIFKTFLALRGFFVFSTVNEPPCYKSME